MNILIVTPAYPDRYKVHYPFVKQLADEFARQGHKCFVIAPYSITNNKRFYPAKEYDGNVMVYRPNYLSFSNYKIGKIKISDVLRRRSINRATKWLPFKPDVVYCHFWECAIEAYPYAKSYNIPLFVATGESSIESFNITEEVTPPIRDFIKGVICVSSKNRDESIELGLTTTEKCVVLPNAVNSVLFKKLDKNVCRKELGILDDRFVVSYVGAFINRKGSKRLSDAISSIEGEPVYSIFIGKGEQEPTCENVLFKGRLLHEQIPLYLNASDVFVLPTLAEGCCNAVVEAMACGLPIVSSNLSFNFDVLNENNAILIDPLNIKEITDAIKYLRDNKAKREEMSLQALKVARNLTIEKRAKGILDFIKSKI